MRYTTSVNGVRSFIIAVGSHGCIRHFAGEQYEPIDVISPTMAHLKAVWVNSSTDAWAVGDGGTILRWNGAAWSSVLLASPRDELRTVWC